jgi:hypothetical protein
MVYYIIRYIIRIYYKKLISNNILYIIDYEAELYKSHDRIWYYITYSVIWHMILYNYHDRMDLRIEKHIIHNYTGLTYLKQEIESHHRNSLKCIAL